MFFDGTYGMLPM